MTTEPEPDRFRATAEALKGAALAYKDARRVMVRAVTSSNRRLSAMLAEALALSERGDELERKGAEGYFKIKRGE